MSVDFHSVAPRFGRDNARPNAYRTARAMQAGLAMLVTCQFAFAAGCGRAGPRPVPVSGRVLLDGQPVRGGYIRVVPQEGRAAGGRIDNDGRFTLSTHTENDGCLPGTHAVEVAVGEIFGDESLGISPPPVDAAALRHYADIETSGLQVTIDGPTDALLIDLPSANVRP